MTSGFRILLLQFGSPILRGKLLGLSLGLKLWEGGHQTFEVLRGNNFDIGS